MKNERIYNLLNELKNNEDWARYNDVRKLLRSAEKMENELKAIEDKKNKIENSKRVTIFERQCLERGLCNYYKEVTERDVLYNATDKKIAKHLEELNKNKRSRFFEVKHDFNTKTKKGLIEYKKYLVEIGEI